MKKAVLRTVLILCILAWMYLIFGFSKESPEVSNAQSGRVVRFLASVFFPDLDLQGEDADFMIRFVYFVRKAAHMTEFAVLGGLLAGLFCTFRMNSFLRMLLSFIIGVLYAAADEFHQLFVNGRSGSLFDVLVDSAGVFIGVMSVTAIVLAAWSVRDARRTTRAEREPGIPNDPAIP